VIEDGAPSGGKRGSMSAGNDEPFRHVRDRRPGAGSQPYDCPQCSGGWNSLPLLRFGCCVLPSVPGAHGHSHFELVARARSWAMRG
jgi:hypothetical protein